ncbi:quinone oxidoreductase [Marinobacter sp. 2_MG-2023]|uniref:quinone oxidoreductase family protein n=1 Tax=Marinobacter sp. 2_MG-2023 TaxID=3062679 RepID=UPI0026E1E09F|nr:quinone oxidoreductase [Marinobacter sp. 2_MG-2023]MDO6441442.1 quinone oxidoreductase [Marinobacter sp. 2_MG-2023]
MTDISAKQIRIHAYGDPACMKYEQVDAPVVGEDEVLIQQKAIGVNYLDTYHRRGVFPIQELPGVLGVEGAGIVGAVGANVKDFQPGDRVSYAAPIVGSYTDVRVLPSRFLVKLPSKITFEQAAAVTLQGLTAHMLVNRVRILSPGQTALVHAAAGGLGLILCQWLAHIGVRVIGTVGSEEKAKLALSHGCSDVILYRDQNFVDETARLTNGEGVDVVYEGLGGDVLDRSLDCLKPFGTAVNLGQVADNLPSIDISRLGPQRALTLAVPGIFAHIRTCPSLQNAADELFGLVRSGVIKVHIGGRYPLPEAAQAHRDLASRTTTGSLVLIPE